MKYQKYICYSILGMYFVGVVADSIAKHEPIEIDDGIIPFFVNAVGSGTTSTSSATLIPPLNI